MLHINQYMPQTFLQVNERLLPHAGNCMLWETNTYQSLLIGAMKETCSHTMICSLYTQHKLHVGHVMPPEIVQSCVFKTQLTV